ncbi:MAG: hypothetical protein KDC56_11540, partial [Flavobacteriaceae bacterium]|nr:hypothetical protein [Flavobacteriaceae bacterium]
GSNTEEDPFFERLFIRAETDLLYTSFSEIAFRAVFGFEPAKDQMKEFEALLALTLTNGPGTISAKGAKESVSARNHISTVYAGFMANTGFAHGGNGFEAVAFLLESFKDIKIDDPGIAPDAGILDGIALQAARNYKVYKDKAKSKGESYKRIPCINHPVFKGKEVNIDPREAFVYKEFKAQGIDNAFWDFYHRLVQALFETGVSENVYCVNIDAVIAVITLKLMWKAYKDRTIAEAGMQQIGFVIFLLGRMAGVSAEIADHMDRGQDMDCRTPTSALRFIV